MIKKIITLAELPEGQKARVRRIRRADNMQRRLLDIGLTEHTEVECLGHSPLGDPGAYLIRGAVIALRREDSGRVLVEQSLEE